jgi:hypothetical protein
VWTVKLLGDPVPLLLRDMMGHAEWVFGHNSLTVTKRYVEDSYDDIDDDYLSLNDNDNDSDSEVARIFPETSCGSPYNYDPAQRWQIVSSDGDTIINMGTLRPTTPPFPPPNYFGDESPREILEKPKLVRWQKPCPIECNLCIPLDYEKEIDIFRENAMNKMQ